MALASLAILAIFATGCAYSAVAMDQHGKAIVTRTDYFLFFPVASHVYVCQVTDHGLSQCKSHEEP
jgi:hypothetical protein